MVVSEAKKKNARRILQCLVAICLFALCPGLSFAKYGNPRFSPDERLLAFDYCMITCGFVILELETGRATAFVKPKNDGWIHPSFGPSSDLLTFIVSPGPGNAQVAVSKVDGTAFRVVTTSPTTKRWPSFSPDGRSVVFAGNEYMDPDRRRGQGLVDAYIVDVASAVEQRVTDLRVLGMSGLFYMPDGKQIVFSTVGSARPRSRRPAPIIELERMFHNKIFVLPIVGDQTLVPYVRDLEIATQPMPIRTGEVAVTSRSRHVNRLTKTFDHDVYLVSSSGSHRLTQFNRYIRSYGIAPSGRFVAFVTMNADDGREDAKLMLWRKDADHVEEIVIVLDKVTLIEVRR